MRTVARRFAGLALVLGMLLPTGVAFADYKDHFKDGFNAVERKKWSEAAESLRRAIAERPESGGRPVLIYGRRFEPYLPHYYLGVALYNLGDLDGAARAWREAERQGEVLDSPVEKDFRELYDQVKGRLVADAEPEEPPTPEVEPTPTEPSPAQDRASLLAEATAKASAAIDRAEAASRDLATGVPEPGLDDVLAESTGLRSRAGRAAERLEEAKAALREGQSASDPERVASAVGLADTARSEYEGLLPDVRREAEAIRIAAREAAEAERRAAAEAERRRELREALVRSAADAERALEGADEIGAPPSGLLAEKAQLQRLVRRVEREAESLDVAGLEALDRSLRQSTEAVQGATREARVARESSPAERPDEEPATVAARPPESLERAVEAYFSAEYERTLQILGEDEYTDLRATVQAHLLRAASAFTLYRLGREEGDELLETARREVESLRRLQPSFTPDPSVFSPSFVAFFERAG